MLFLPVVNEGLRKVLNSRIGEQGWQRVGGRPHICLGRLFQLKQDSCLSADVTIVLSNLSHLEQKWGPAMIPSSFLGAWLARC